MSIEMLTPLFTPMTQVSADDSRHEVRLTISDDVQAILHTDQHLLVINKTYDSGTVSYMLRCDNHKILLARLALVLGEANRLFIIEGVGVVCGVGRVVAG